MNETEYYDDFSGFTGAEVFDTQDPTLQSAIDEIKEYFESNKARLFFLKQVQIHFEKKYFHWVSYNAINYLIETKEIQHEIIKVGNQEIKILFNRKLRYRKRMQKSMQQVIREYSDENVSAACGEYADILFCSALMREGFLIIDEDTNKLGDKKWEKTGHNLDLIISRDGIYYGCEIKNTFDYIPRDELEVKLDICKHLGAKPLFIMRSAPKTYNFMIIQAGGFSLIFRDKIFPIGKEILVEKIIKELGLPVKTWKSIPTGTIARFVNWHNKHVNSQNIHTSQ